MYKYCNTYLILFATVLFHYKYSIYLIVSDCTYVHALAAVHRVLIHIVNSLSPIVDVLLLYILTIALFSLIGQCIYTHRKCTCTRYPSIHYMQWHTHTYTHTHGTWHTHVHNYREQTLAYVPHYYTYWHGISTMYPHEYIPNARSGIHTAIFNNSLHSILCLWSRQQHSE